jgi:hypothetical protein
VLLEHTRQELVLAFPGLVQRAQLEPTLWKERPPVRTVVRDNRLAQWVE